MFQIGMALAQWVYACGCANHSARHSILTEAVDGHDVECHITAQLITVNFHHFVGEFSLEIYVLLSCHNECTVQCCL